MNISGIRASAGFYEYNDIKSSELRGQQIQQAKAQEAKQEQLPEEAQSVQNQQNFTSYDYAKQYEPEATYEMKGADSDIALLDVEKVLSDVQKDAVLQQYQFFVGESENQTKSVRDTSVDFSENFTI